MPGAPRTRRGSSPDVSAVHVRIWFCMRSNRLGVCSDVREPADLEGSSGAIFLVPPCSARSSLRRPPARIPRSSLRSPALSRRRARRPAWTPASKLASVHFGSLLWDCWLCDSNPRVGRQTAAAAIDPCHRSARIARDEATRRGMRPVPPARFRQPLLATVRRGSTHAAYVVDKVLPSVPLRQWVVSFPYEMRLLLAKNPDVLSAVLRLVMRVIFATRRLS